jgi:hypothetical protein
MQVKKEIMTLLSKHIMYMEKPRRTVTEKMVDILSNLIPEEEDASLHQKPMPASL